MVQLNAYYSTPEMQEDELMAAPIAPNNPVAPDDLPRALRVLEEDALSCEVSPI
jgi:hypothetical protein